MAQAGHTAATPKHKATFSFGVRCNCSCGWASSTWYGKGAQRSAANEFQDHKERAHSVEAQS